MLNYDFGHNVEAFSTNISDNTDFDVVLPLHQAHGTKCVVVDANGPIEDTYGTDALISRTPGVRIGVKTADCVPILLYNPVSKAVAAIHSGWKGTKADIIGKTIEKMVNEWNIDTHDTIAVIGPCIHMEAFEVGDELYDIFSAAGYADYCRRMPAFGSDSGVKWHINLPGICKSQLIKSGVNKVEVRPECTYNLHHDFYSARRLGKNFGKQRIISCIRILE